VGIFVGKTEAFAQDIKTNAGETWVALNKWECRLSDGLSDVVYGHFPCRKFSSLMLYDCPECSGLRYDEPPQLGNRSKSKAALEIQVDLCSEQLLIIEIHSKKDIPWLFVLGPDKHCKHGETGYYKRNDWRVPFLQNMEYRNRVSSLINYNRLSTDKECDVHL
jgi:hypothetical protein